MFSTKEMCIMVKFGRKIAGIALGVSLLGVGAAEAAVSPDALVV